MKIRFETYHLNLGRLLQTLIVVLLLSSVSAEPVHAMVANFDIEQEEYSLMDSDSEKEDSENDNFDDDIEEDKSSHKEPSRVRLNEEVFHSSNILTIYEDFVSEYYPGIPLPPPRR